MTETKLTDQLNEFARKSNRPDGTNYNTLLHGDEILLMQKTGYSQKDIQIAALQNDIIPERYCRNQRSLSNSDQIKLLKSKIAVIGQGGLGGTVTEILARLGIGRLILVDGDVFEDSNLNRQLLSNVENLGMNKAVVGQERVKLINPAVDVDAFSIFLTSDNGEEILFDVDIAVDCLDSIPARFVLEDACRKKRIPLISAAIGGTTGQATVVFPEDPGLEKIYGAPDVIPAKGIETQLGTLPYAAVFMAAIECAEVVSILCRNRSQLRNSLLIANVDGQEIEKVSFS